MYKLQVRLRYYVSILSSIYQSVCLVLVLILACNRSLGGKQCVSLRGFCVFEKKEFLRETDIISTVWSMLSSKLLNYERSSVLTQRGPDSVEINMLFLKSVLRRYMSCFSSVSIFAVVVGENRWYHIAEDRKYLQLNRPAAIDRPYR